MSSANKCDVCGILYAATVGDMRIEYDITTHVDVDGDRKMQGWSSDICPGCAVAVLKAVNHPDDDGRSE